MQTLHTYYQRYLAMLTERLLRRTLDEAEWQTRLANEREKLRTKEQIWARTPDELERQTAVYLEHIDEQLSITKPALTRMKSYRDDDERQEYSRLVDYRAALIAERDRILQMLAEAVSRPHAA